MPFGNTVCHRIYPLIAWTVYSKSQSLLAAVLNRAAALWGSRVPPYQGHQLPPVTHLHPVKNNNSKRRLKSHLDIWLVLRPEMGRQQRASSSSKESWPFSLRLTQMRAVNNCNLFFPRSHLFSSLHLTLPSVVAAPRSMCADTHFRCLR